MKDLIVKLTLQCERCCNTVDRTLVNPDLEDNLELYVENMRHKQKWYGPVDPDHFHTSLCSTCMPIELEALVLKEIKGWRAKQILIHFLDLGDMVLYPQELSFAAQLDTRTLRKEWVYQDGKRPSLEVYAQYTFLRPQILLRDLQAREIPEKYFPDKSPEEILEMLKESKELLLGVWPLEDWDAMDLDDAVSSGFRNDCRDTRWTWLDED